jgi:hypothetical protein
LVPRQTAIALQGIYEIKVIGQQYGFLHRMLPYASGGELASFHPAALPVTWCRSSKMGRAFSAPWHGRRSIDSALLTASESDAPGNNLNQTRPRASNRRRVRQHSLDALDRTLDLCGQHFIMFR